MDSSEFVAVAGMGVTELAGSAMETGADRQRAWAMQNSIAGAQSRVPSLEHALQQFPVSPPNHF